MVTYPKGVNNNPNPVLGLFEKTHIHIHNFITMVYIRFEKQRCGDNIVALIGA